jgi:Protein of unknown function (DUF1549)/Protein of unknown function (DUF1553)
MSRRLLAFGACTIVICCAVPARAAMSVPGQSPLQTVDFERHVVALFSKAGCNNGSCHGSFQGKGGFRLSLFGYDADKDFAAVTREAGGRRVNAVEPDKSLILLKATGQIPHEGGVRFVKDSWQYGVFRSWIADSANWHRGSGTVAALILDQPEYVFVKPGGTQQLQVKARYADGGEESVTAFCDFRIADDAVAEVNPLGVVKANRPGDTGLMVSYRGTVQAVRVLVPATVPADFQYPDVPAANYIDREVVAKLKQLNMVPSELSSDVEFLRRVTIDAIGSLPTPDEVRAFLADQSADKRVRKIDELLAHPLHAALWATKLSDVTGNNTDSLENPAQLKARRSQQWHDWLRKRVAENVPYDQIVQGILTATSREGMSPEEWVKMVERQDEAIDKGFDDSYKDRHTLDLFWRRQQQVQLEQWGEKVAAAFLGIRLECAQCHKHPTDRWTQVDYRAFANLFGQVVSGPPSPETRQIVDELNAKRREQNTGNNNNRLNLVRETYIAAPVSREPPKNAKAKAKAAPKAAAKAARSLPHPETNQPLPPKALGGPVLPVEPGKDVRAALFLWMRSPDNPYFARSFVNRVWAHYFGVGLVDPVDNFSVANPPTNARLLDALARDFIEHNFDLRYIERTILNSRTYQLSSTPNATNQFDKNNFAHGYVRPLMAEVVVDVLNSALGTSESFGNDGRPGAKMVEVGASRLTGGNAGNLMYALRIFGRPPRTTACDCERALDPALPQTLFRMIDPAVIQKLSDKGGRLATLLRDKEKTDAQVFEELVLATFSRPPTDAEQAAFAEYRARESNRQTAFTDTLWALINTREFILNH